MSKLHLMNRPGLIFFMYIGFGCLACQLSSFMVLLKIFQLNWKKRQQSMDVICFKHFFLIVLPLLKGIMATVAVINVMWIWNDFLFPSLIINKNGMQTLPLRTYLFFGQFTKKNGIWRQQHLYFV